MLVEVCLNPILKIIRRRRKNMLKKCTIYFHKVQCKITPFNDITNPHATLYDAINYIINKNSNIDNNTFVFKNGTLNIMIEIISFDKSHIFGSIGKLIDINKNFQTRTRDQTTLKVISDNLDFYLEQFSFFYIDIPRNKVARLSSNNAPAFRKHFSYWIQNNYPFTISVDFPHVIIPKLNRYKYNKVIKIDYKYAPEKIGNKTILGFGQLDRASANDYSNMSVVLNVKPDIPSKKIWDDMGEDYAMYKDLKVLVEDDEGMKQTIDLLQNIFTYHTQIEIPEETENFKTLIKKELVRCLSAHNYWYSID